MSKRLGHPPDEIGSVGAAHFAQSHRVSLCLQIVQYLRDSTLLIRVFLGEGFNYSWGRVLTIHYPDVLIPPQIVFISILT